MTELVQRIAVKAVIVNDDRVLLLRKSNDDVRHAGKSGRYNLPGGKVEPGEKTEDALKREVLEETGLVLSNNSQKPLFVGEWRPSIKDVHYQIIGIFFLCREWQGEVQLDSEHDKYVWIDAQSVDTYDILPPEDKAILEYFSKHS